MSTSGGASRSRSRARARRLCTFASVVNSRSAISAVLKPHSVFSARTSRDSRGIGVVAADEEHAQQVVAHLAGEMRGRRIVGRRRRVVGGPLQDPEPAGVLAQIADQVVVRDAVEPGAGVVGKPVGRPRGERGHERGLHRVLDELEVPDADHAREHRHQPAVLVPEEVLDQTRRGDRSRRSRCDVVAQTAAISRISMRAPGIMHARHLLRDLDRALRSSRRRRS